MDRKGGVSATRGPSGRALEDIPVVFVPLLKKVLRESQSIACVNKFCAGGCEEGNEGKEKGGRYLSRKTLALLTDS